MSMIVLGKQVSDGISPSMYEVLVAVLKHWTVLEVTVSFSLPPQIITFLPEDFLCVGHDLVFHWDTIGRTIGQA